jgi:adenosylmethionine-8-amino-7-oxononanoate aminotransferase
MTSHVFHRAAGPGTSIPAAIRAAGCEITDADGRVHLDACAGALAANLGHGDPTIIDALAAQLRTVDWVHAATFTTPVLEQYAAELAAVVPVDDARVFPVSGGSEAIETAAKLARSYHLARGEPARHVLLARERSYHGTTRGALDLSDREPLRVPYEPWLGLTARVPAAYPYRVPLTAEEHAAALETAIADIGAERVAAFVAEPIGGATTGASVPPDGYWPAIAAVCRRHGILLVADEVMTGFGRTGAWFACDHWGLRPDLLVAGKGASAGYWPLGLVVASGAVHDTVAAAGGFVHGFTWSHHPGGAAVGRAVLARLHGADLVARAASLGARLRDALAAALEPSPIVGDVRGRGLLVGIELVADRATAAPFPRPAAIAERVVAAGRDARVLLYPSTGCADGIAGDLVLVGPPLTITDPELDAVVERTVAAIGAVARAPA